MNFFKSLVLYVAFLIVLSGQAFATCTSTITNTSASSTTTLQDTADGQCLINSGTITPASGSGAFELGHNNTLARNSGTINLNTSSQLAAFYTWPGVAGANIENSGTINASGNAADIYAIWLAGSGVVNSIVNSGTINMTNTGQSVGIFNYASDTVTTLTNSGTISTTGDLYAIGNNSHIGTLNNSGSITTTGTSNGISNNGSSSVIDTIINTGTISAVYAGQYGILNNGVIGTLNNSQGAGNSAGALTYTGVLPTNYNIIINSATHYGQLALTSPSGTTTFGIYNGGVTGVAASVLAKGTYSSVLSGITSSNLTGATTGNYNGFTWRLNNSIGNIWDLIVTGASTADTQASLQSLANSLRSSFSSQAVATNFANMNTYDCDLFDEKGVCLSVGGQQAYVDNSSVNQTSAVVVMGYKLSPHIRVGGFLNQNLRNNAATGVHLSNANPLMGLFAVWNQNENNLGYQVKIANAYQERDVATIRDAVATSEAGAGSTHLNTQSYVGKLSYAFLVNEDRTLVSPYAAIRYTQIKQDGFTEQSSSTVTAPLSYAALEDRSTTVLVGVKLDHQLPYRVNLTASLGVEQDLAHHVDNLIATGISGLSSVVFNDSIKRTRPVASIGAYYAPVKNQRITADLYYQQLPYQNTGSTIAYVNYMIGF